LSVPSGSSSWAISCGKLSISTRANPAEKSGCAKRSSSASMSRARVAMFALEHAMWTRGQLVPYLHAHGVAVPAQRLF